MDFTTLYSMIDSLTEEQLDALPYGVIQLDAQGTILHYNDYESELAQLPRASVIGKNFFRDVAPCTDVQEFHGRFTEGVANRRLDVKFRYHFAFAHNPRTVQVTLFYSAITSSVWVIVQPVD